MQHLPRSSISLSSAPPDIFHGDEKYGRDDSMKESGPPGIMAVYGVSLVKIAKVTISWIQEDHIMLYVGIDQHRVIGRFKTSH